MNRQSSPKQTDADSDALLNYLTSQQHLHAHRAVKDVLDETTAALGCCPHAIDRGIEWLAIDPSLAIGRLRRSEIVQLARAVHRFWMQSAGITSGAK